MTGTYGRILANLQSSPVFEKDIRFIPHRVTLVEDGNPIKRLAIDLARSARSLSRRPDVLHFLMSKYKALYREFPTLNAARAIGVRTIVDIRAGTLQAMLNRKGYDPGAGIPWSRDYKLQNAMMRNLLRHADAVVLECPKDVTFVRERFGREGLHLPNAAMERDVERVSPATDLPDGKERPIRLIHSGRYSREKGTAVLLESLNILSGRGVKVELHLTGQGKEPELLRTIRSYVEKPPAGTVVVDHGWDVPDLYALMASGHVIVMATEWAGEGHPNVVTEAMMAGLGMILSDWLHRGDIVPREGAIIVPPRDPEALADAVERYAGDSVLLAAARRANRKRVEERFIDRVCYAPLLDLYKSLVKPGGE
jgi:glycosyltransferase involved in cell wall biosynthesis